MKKNIYAIFLCLFCLPAVVYLTILIYSTFHSNGRTYEATVDRSGWQMVFTEQNADTLLRFTFRPKGKQKCDSLSFLIYNEFCGNVVSFLFVEGVDTLYIRKNLEFRNLFPPEEQSQHPVAPPDFVVDNPIVGELPVRCKAVSFSDPRFFIYDKKKCSYIPKNAKMHVVTLFHETERANTYYLSDMTQNDTLDVKLYNITD